MMNLNFKEIKIEDKAIFDNFFLKHSIKISEYTFTNLFVWNDFRIIEYAIYKDKLVIKAECENERYLLPPIGDNLNSDFYNELIEYGIKNNIRYIKRVCEDSINNITKIGDLKIIEDRDNFDYVYDTKELVELNGSKYSSKRGFVKKFLDTYDYEYRSFNEEYKKECLDLAEKWVLNKKTEDKTAKNEFIAINKLLNYYDLLKVKSGIILIEGKVKAFAFGEKLNKNTFVIHFEKADTDFVGIYQTINKIFIEKECYHKFEFINREQDLGIPGIRKAKMSYYPLFMIKKYNVSF